MIICKNIENCVFNNDEEPCKFSYPINYRHINTDHKMIINTHNDWHKRGTFIYCKKYMTWMEVKIWKLQKKKG